MLAANLTVLSLVSVFNIGAPMLSVPARHGLGRLNVAGCSLRNFLMPFLLSSSSSTGISVRNSAFKHFQMSAIKITAESNAGVGTCGSKLGGTDVEVKSVLFWDCEGENGGAIYRDASNDFKVDSSAFISCSATGDGGAVYCVGTGGTVTFDGTCFVRCIVRISEDSSETRKGFGAYIGKDIEGTVIEGVTVSECDTVDSVYAGFGFVSDAKSISTKTCNFTSPEKLGNVGFLSVRYLSSVSENDITYTSCEKIQIYRCHDLIYPTTGTFDPQFCQYFNVTFQNKVIDDDPSCFYVYSETVDQKMGTVKNMYGFNVIVDDETKWVDKSHLVKTNKGWFLWTGCYSDFDDWKGNTHGGITLTNAIVSHTVNPEMESYCFWQGSETFSPSPTFSDEVIVPTFSDEGIVPNLPTAPVEEGEGDSMSVGIIGGIIAGAVVALLAIIAVVAVVVKRNSKKVSSSEQIPEVETVVATTTIAAGRGGESMMITGNNALYEGGGSSDPFEDKE